MTDCTIRQAKPQDDLQFSELAMFTGPELIPALFGPKAQHFWQVAFHHKKCCFSFEHAYFIEVNNEIAGMALIYDYQTKKREELHSVWVMLRHLKWALFRQLPALRQSGEIMARINTGDHYLSNLALFPQYRGIGYGAKLMDFIEEKARNDGSTRMVLDAETDNERGIQFYQQRGYRIESKLPALKTRDGDFELFKMSKDLN